MAILCYYRSEYSSKYTVSDMLKKNLIYQMIPSYNLCAILICICIWQFWCIWYLFWDHSCSKQILGQCSAETRPLRKQNIFVIWQLFQLICDLNLEQYGRVLEAIFGSFFKDFVIFRPIIDKTYNFRWFFDEILPNGQ